jgi:asparaginyl-tRNA synthetase
MSQVLSVEGALKGRVAIGQQLTVKGWLRSKRDSKAGISFLAIHDGSCFDAIQAKTMSQSCLSSLPVVRWW